MSFIDVSGEETSLLHSHGVDILGEGTSPPHSRGSGGVPPPSWK